MVEASNHNPAIMEELVDTIPNLQMEECLVQNSATLKHLILYSIIIEDKDTILS